MSDRITVREAADMLGVEPSTLYSWRARNYGPKSFTVGTAVRYERAEVQAYIDKCKAETTRGAA